MLYPQFFPTNDTKRKIFHAGMMTKGSNRSAGKKKCVHFLTANPLVVDVNM